MTRDNPDPLHEKAMAVYRRLVEAYGEPAPARRLDPVSQLVTTILSQNTSDVNQHRAFRRMRERFPTWEEVRQAPLEEIEETIRLAGMARQRAPRIQHALNYILERRGELSLDFLREMPAAEARAWLTEIKGIGPKTAAIVLLFSLGMPAFPVDTHVHRVSRRLGLAPGKATPEQVGGLLEALIPGELYYPYHVDLIEHGRRVCRAQRPLCEQCTLNDLCDYYQARAPA